jgi:hypothetical protein
MGDPQSIQFAGTSNGSAAVIFSGPPLRLRGHFRLVNPSAQKLKLTSLPIETDSLLGPARLPVRSVAVGVRLAPGEQAMIPGTLRLDPQTPPGSYDFSVNIAGQSVPATAHVTDVVDFRMEPATVTLLVGAETSFERTFVIENAGNVPLPLGERCEAPLIDSIDLETAMLAGLHEALEDELKLKVDAWLDEWGRRSGGMLAIVREPIILRPGQKITASATFELPEDLKPYRCYHANLQLYNATISVDIYTTRKAGSENAKTPRKRGKSDGL